jgi:hypothetical protein
LIAVLDRVKSVGNLVVEDAVRNESDILRVTRRLRGHVFDSIEWLEWHIWVNCSLPGPEMENQHEPSTSGGLFVVHFGKPMPLPKCTIG